MRLRGASFGYGDHMILEAVDLEIKAGEFLGILGPNGSGKSTLLKGMLGLIPVRAGDLIRNVERLGYVPQRESLDRVFPLSVEEVVLMGAYGRRSGLVRTGEIERDRVRESLERVGLSHRTSELYSSLSGGQRQRVLIARALVMRPQLLLLDEPTTGIDERAQEVVSGLLEGLNRREGVAILCVTHDRRALASLTEDVLHVADGRCVRGPLLGKGRTFDASSTGVEA